MKSRNQNLAICILTLVSPFVFPQAKEAFAPRMFKSATHETLPYQIHFPAKLEPGKKYPLVLFFHGAGERGSDNQKQLVHGARPLLAYSEKNNEPAIIVAPQCPAGQQWVDTPWGNDFHTMPETPSKSMKLAMALLDEIVAKHPVDPTRIYVTGLSMGGFGTWDIIQRQPERFAAAMPVCGGGDLAEAKKLVKLPIWAFHGGSDTTVKTKRSRDMTAAIKAAGGKPNYTEYPGVGHNSWSKAYSDQKALKWLFSQKRAE